MKRKNAIIIFDEKSQCEPLVPSRVRRKPGSVFLIVPSEYLGSTNKWFRLMTDAVARKLLKTGGHVA